MNFKKIVFIITMTLIAALVFLLFPRQSKIAIYETGGGLNGKAPVYNVTIYDDGHVQYIGQDHVKVIGKVSFSLSIEKTDKIFNKIKKINFQHLKDEYEILPDSSVSIISVDINGNKKEIAHDTQAGPKELLVIESEIRKNVEKFVK